MAEAHWYVVHTYSGYENKVKANIDKTIENRHLEDQILEVRVPMQDVVELKNGTNKTVSKKMFPGYVLINMVMNDDTWYVVRNTRGVTGFVGPGSKPVPLTDMEMRPLGIKTENIEVDFAEGDTVVVTGGVWKDTIGVIQATTSVYPGYPRRLEINGEKGSIALEENSIAKWDIYSGSHEDIVVQPAAFSSASTPTAISLDGHTRQIADMIRAIKTGTRPTVDVYEGRKPVDLILAIYRSAEEGRPIDL